MRSWSRAPIASDSRRGPAAQRTSRSRLRGHRQGGSLISALREEAGYDAAAYSGPHPDHGPDDSLPRFIGNGRKGPAGRVGAGHSRGGTPQWMKAARRARWRARARNGLAWTATILVAGAIILGAALILRSATPVTGPPLEPGRDAMPAAAKAEKP